MSFEAEREQELRRSREASAEYRETRESPEMDEAAKAAAAMERADVLVKEVKGGKQQIQNIMVHMQSVLQALTALRQQLQLEDNENISSIEQDKKHIEKLKIKIAEHKDELLKMKDELITAQVEQIREGEGASLGDVELRHRAEEMVQRLVEQIEQ